MFNFNNAVNNVSSDVYFGLGCGKMITERILNAKKRIWILSPYVDFKSCNLLVKKIDEGVRIRLITHDDQLAGLRSEKSKLNDVIIENVTINGKKLFAFLTLLLFGVASIIFSALFFFSRHIGKLFADAFIRPEAWKGKLDLIGYVLSGFSGKQRLLITKVFSGFPFLDLLLFGGITLLGILLLFLSFRFTRFHHYSYACKFPIRFLENPYKTKSSWVNFIHQKIYLIDDEVFLGSVNFTEKGFTTNIETRVRSSDRILVQKVDEYLKDLYEQNIFVDFDKLAYRIFKKNTSYPRSK
jgi:phosphatidylserine/phosphatidylglycerophosphate/cardiolipin synthase-like enzyme